MGKEVVEMTVKDYIYNLTTALNYNRTTDYTMEVFHRVLKRIKYDYEWRSEHKYDGFDINDDVDIMACAIFLAYGEYGTSPRYGWILDIDVEKEIINTIVMRINELSHMYMEEVLNDT